MRFLSIKGHAFFIAISLLAISVVIVGWIISSPRETKETSNVQKSKQPELRVETKKEFQEKPEYIPPSPPPTSITTKLGITYFIKDNEIWSKEKETEKQLTFDSRGEYKKSFLSLSPNERYLSYFQDLSPKKEMGDDEYYWRNYTSLRILEIPTRNSREVYRGSFTVGSYEWLTDREIAVRVGCGTECSYLELVDISDKSRRQLMYGVGYTWAPNKKYVLAYHYALQAGLTVGDTFGRELLTLRRDYPVGGKWISDHKASWSPHSSKLALIINKDKKPELELLVFNVENGFQLLLQKDLNSSEFTDFGWKDEKTVFYIVSVSDSLRE